MGTAPTIYWMRKDFRLGDNPALEAALEGDGPVIPVFILDPLTEDQLGAAPKWRLSKAIETFTATLADKGARLILRRGEALDTLRALIDETGAKRVVWGRLYDSRSIDRDRKVKAALEDDGLTAISVNAHLIREPWTVETKSGGPYKVYTPYKKSCYAEGDPRDPTGAPSKIPTPESWPDSDRLDAWGLEAPMRRGGEIVARYASVGEEAAQGRLGAFIRKVGGYDEARDIPSQNGTSGLSQHFALGEMSPRTAWHAVRRAIERDPDIETGARSFLDEILWREFAYHLLYHYPALPTENWREDWDAYPWREDNEDAERWRRGMTGIPFVDAAMRELYTTGYMHNRARMLTASLLTKNLRTHWRVGEAWFRDCLVDWDIASNSMGWQWSAGSGPDAAPFFRIFNPETQRDRFDKQGKYVRNWIAGYDGARPTQDGLAFFDAIPREWSLTAETSYPNPIVDLKKSRQDALDAYQAMKN